LSFDFFFDVFYLINDAVTVTVTVVHVVKVLRRVMQIDWILRM
jgi:hypothetical protein